MKSRTIAIIGILMIMGIMVFGGCNGKLVEVDAEIVELSTWHFTSGVPNNLITVNHSEANAIFEISVDKGTFWVYEEQRYLQTVTVNNGETIYWHEFDTDGGWLKVEIAYANIIAKVDDNIVGYAVIKIFKNDSNWFSAEVLKSVVFPKVNDQYQKVTIKQIETKIAEAKK